MDEDDRPTSIMSAPPMSTEREGAPRVRIAAVGDMHCSKETGSRLGPLFSSVHEVADVMLLCGDLTDYGTPEEAHLLVKELASVRVPMVAVLGNHDHESQQADKVTEILREAGIHVLDGDSCQIGDVGFAGVKGFLGGFGRGTLGSWGEASVKLFVQEAIDESLKLESALARLKTEKRIAVLHYSPIAGTVIGEPIEIFPFLGCSRLEEPLVRYPVAAVFHGHAHKGTPEGHTVNGIPVYNVAMPLLLRTFRGHPPFRVVEV
jgi:Icc-related predicted phosphoesterase